MMIYTKNNTRSQEYAHLHITILLFQLNLIIVYQIAFFYIMVPTQLRKRLLVDND